MGQCILVQHIALVEIDITFFFFLSLYAFSPKGALGYEAEIDLTFFFSPLFFFFFFEVCTSFRSISLFWR